MSEASIQLEQLQCNLMPVLATLTEGVYLVDRERRITYWNPAAERITGYRANDVVGRCCNDNLLAHVDGQGCELCTQGCPLAATIDDGQHRGHEVFLRHRDGRRVAVRVEASPVTDAHGNVVGAAEVFSEIMGQEQLSERIRQLQSMAFIDALTETPNRRCLETTLEQKLDEAQRFNHSVGLILIDIDHFKKVNDTHGHDAGDQLLKLVAKTLTTNTHQHDRIGRWGGEEFLAVISNATIDTINAAANRLCIAVANSSTTFNNTALNATISIGAALSSPGESSQSLITRADHLLYASKTAGRNRATCQTTPTHKTENCPAENAPQHNQQPAERAA